MPQTNERAGKIVSSRCSRHHIGPRISKSRFEPLGWPEYEEGGTPVLTTHMEDPNLAPRHFRPHEPRIEMISKVRTLQIFALSVALMLVFTPAPAALAAPTDHWVGTWAASPVSANNPDGRFGAADTTYREIVHISLGGSRIRIILSNEFGTDSLTIGPRLQSAGWRYRLRRSLT